MDWWSASQAEALRRLHASDHGLTKRQAKGRLRTHGQNCLPRQPGTAWTREVWKRLVNPLVLVLLVASSISAFTGDMLSFVFVIALVLLSIILDMVQEHRAGRAVEALRGSVALTVRVWRDRQLSVAPAEDLVPGDCVELSAGDLIPADGRVLQANDFFVAQALLTGEAYPVEKAPQPSAIDRWRRGGPNPSHERPAAVFGCCCPRRLAHPRAQSKSPSGGAPKANSPERPIGW